jgi:hypothetical protein
METREPEVQLRVPPVISAQRPSGIRLVVAFGVAALSDALSFWLTFVPPVEWGIDLVTALLLFLLLGRRWAILPGLIAEAIPGLGAFPFWLLVVGSIAAMGALRRPQNPVTPPGEGPRLPPPQA